MPLSTATSLRPDLWQRLHAGFPRLAFEASAGGTWRQAPELLHLVPVRRVCGRDSGLLDDDDEHRVAAAGQLVHLGRASGPLHGAPFQQAIHLRSRLPASDQTLPEQMRLCIYAASACCLSEQMQAWALPEQLAGTQGLVVLAQIFTGTQASTALSAWNR